MPHDDAPLDLSFANAPKLTFPDDAWKWFQLACADLEITVDDDKKHTLEALYSHLLYVNESLNLTRITNPLDYLKFHVFDSLTVLNQVEAYTHPGDTVLDLGSGGGYPGLPLLTWLPDRRWVLVDKRPHKVAFLNETLKLTPAQDAVAQAFRGREAAANAPELYQNCQMVMARAVGKGVELLPDASALLELNGVFMLLKGPAYPTDEQADFLRALPSAGFDLIDELNIALDENDPARWVILTTKMEIPKHKAPHSKSKSFKHKNKKQKTI